MLSDARELANDQKVDVDVCIVGAGPAGISIARELIGNGGQEHLAPRRDPKIQELAQTVRTA